MVRVMESTTIQVDTEIRDKMKSIGHKGETYNEIIDRLMSYYISYHNFMIEQYKILDSEQNWISLDEL